MTTPTRLGYNVLDASAGDASTSLTVPADTTLVVALWSHWDGNLGSSLASLAVDGTSMTILAQVAEGATSDHTGTGVAVLANPTIGSVTHAATWSAGGARSEGGVVLFVYLKDADLASPSRDAQLDTSSAGDAASVNLSNVDASDLIIAYMQSYTSGSNPYITTLTEFVNATLNSEKYRANDGSGSSGTVAVSTNSGTGIVSYASIVAIAVKGAAGGSQSATYTEGASAADTLVSQAQFANGYTETLTPTDDYTYPSGASLVRVLRGRTLGRGLGRGMR